MKRGGGGGGGWGGKELGTILKTFEVGPVRFKARSLWGRVIKQIF